MRDQLGKPLLLLAIILLLLGVISLCWLYSGPSPAAGDAAGHPGSYHRQVEQLIHEVEGQR